MSTQFKVGDKVRRKAEWAKPGSTWGASKSLVATVTKVIPQAAYNNLWTDRDHELGHTGGWDSARFELASAQVGAFQKGDTVYCAMFGKGKVVDVNAPSTRGYKVVVKFDSGKSGDYTQAGHWRGDMAATLSFVPWVPPADQFKRPYTPRFKKGDIVFVGFASSRALREVVEDTEKGVTTFLVGGGTYSWAHYDVHPYTPLQ